MGKLHQAFFYALIVLLPVQLGRHFWPESSYVLGLKIDYLSPTVYLTDLLIGLIFILWAWEEKARLTFRNLKSTAKNLWWVGAIFIFLLVNSVLAPSPLPAIFKFFKVLEFFLLAFYIAKNEFDLRTIRKLLSLVVAYSSLIVLGQFIKQASLAGPFWWLGERTFNAFSPGIAKAILAGQLVMRPYGTFPHPNALAGFILVSLILIGVSKKGFKVGKAFSWLPIFLGIGSLVVSFSRSAWLVCLLMGALILLFQVKERERKAFSRLTIGNLSFFLFLVFLGGMVFYFGPRFSTEEAFFLRMESARVALRMVGDYPLTGVGLNNFIPQLPFYWQAPETVRFLQPVHNLYLLMIAETGLAGLVIFLWLLVLTVKKILGHYRLIFALSAILLLGFFDHYWLTLQQNQLLLVLVLGLSWAKKK